MNRARGVGTDGREEVVLVEADVRVLELLSVPRVEDGSGARAVANAEDVSLRERGAVRLSRERVRVRLEAVRGEVADRVLAPPCCQGETLALTVPPTVGALGLPGNRKLGNGLVARPMETTVAAGFS